MAKHAGKQRSPVPSIQQALTLHQQGRLLEADLLYGAILKADPGNFDALHLSGVLRHQQGRSAEGLRLVAKALKAQPKSADVLTNYGVILDALKRHGEALETFEKVLAGRAADAGAHYNRGNALKGLKRYAEAAGSYERALALAPGHIDARYNRGIALAALGRHQDALADYEAVLAQQPKHAGALNRRGISLAALDRPLDALSAYDAALAATPDNAEVLNNRSVTLVKLERFDEALRDCDRALALRPECADAHYNRGNALRGLERYEDARVSYEAALELEPGRADVLNNLGLALTGLDRHAEALELFDKVLALNADNLGALHNRANALSELGSRGAPAVPGAATPESLRVEALNTRGAVLAKLRRFSEALESYDAALDLAPDRMDIVVNRGTALLELDRHEEAIACFDRALAAEPENLTALINRGNGFLRGKRFDDALGSYEKALAINPDSAAAITDRGVALAELDRFEEALDAAEHALRVEPHNFAAHVNRGNALLKLNRMDGALECYADALARDPENAEANFNSALAKLCLGRFEGWEQYEYRWKKKPMSETKPDYPQPVWRGEGDIAGKTILLLSEQGLGDTINFIRYVPMVADLGANVIVAVQKPLRTLAATVRGVSVVRSDGEALPDFDLYCPLLSLPLAFGTRLETVPANIPYLWPLQERLDKWRDKLPDNGRLRIGLCWAGNKDHLNDRKRSIPLAQFAALLSVPNLDFISVQKDVNDADAAMLREHNVNPLGREFDDFADTAAVVAMLDLVICVDTSVAHLAGAMGKAVALLLPFSPDFRWLLDRTDSPWYPSMRLFRQPRINDWDGPLEKVRAELLEVSQRRAKNHAALTTQGGAIRQHDCSREPIVIGPDGNSEIESPRTGRGL